MIYRYRNFTPFVHPDAFVHPLACVTGCVRIGSGVYVGPYAVLRGDFGEIVIEDGCNVQEHCMLHMFPGITVHLEKDVHVGHGAIIHGARIGRNSLIGMNCVIMDDVVVGEECIVGAMSFIREGQQFEKRSLIVGNPARVVRGVNDEMINWKSKGTALYQELANRMQSEFEVVSPHREMPDEWPVPNGEYLSWRNVQNK